MENKKSNTKKNIGIGCLSIFILFILFVSITKMCDSPSSTDQKNTTDSLLNKKVSNNINENEVNTNKKDSLKIKELSKFFIEEKDEFSEKTWIKAKTTSKYSIIDAFYCYFQKDGDIVYNFRFVGQYHAEDWLFVEKIIFNVDGANYTYYPKDMKRDNSGYSIWEYYDNSVNMEDASLIYAIANAKKVKVRFYGSQYYSDRTISSEQIKSIKNTLEYYEALGGKFD